MFDTNQFLINSMLPDKKHMIIYFIIAAIFGTYTIYTLPIVDEFSLYGVVLVLRNIFLGLFVAIGIIATLLIYELRKMFIKMTK